MGEITATHLIAQYMWHVMRTELGYDPNDYGSIAAISVAGQQQELASFTKPYVLMGWSSQPVDLWLIERQIASFTIFSQDITDINEFVNLFVDRFKRMDESAKLVNDWLSAQPQEYKDHYGRFDIKSIQFRASVGPQPPLQEGGRHDGNIIVSIEFVDLLQ